nr:hypothetical protein CFP56_67505 [Quercus suber]
MEDLESLMGKSPHELMSSHLHKLIQAERQADKALSKVEKASTKAVEKFKVSDKYSEKLCDYYMEGFELFRKYLAKHHLELNFSNLDMEAVEKEVLANRQFVEGVGEGGEVVAISEAVNVDLSSWVLP